MHRADERSSPRILPLPPQTTVWVSWEDGSVEDYPALFIAFTLSSYAISTTETGDEWDPATKKRSSYPSFPPWAARHVNGASDQFEYTSIHVFVPRDWESPWLEVGEYAFWSDQAAHEKAAARLEKAQAKAKAKAAGAP